MRGRLADMTRTRAAAASSPLIRPCGATFPLGGRLGGSHPRQINFFCNRVGFPRGGSCQRPRPLTDEGQTCRYDPYTGCRGKLSPHPALRGHLPPRGKAWGFTSSPDQTKFLQSSSSYTRRGAAWRAKPPVRLCIWLPTAPRRPHRRGAIFPHSPAGSGSSAGPRRSFMPSQPSCR